MHAAAYRALHLPHTYEAIRAAPSDLPHLLSELRGGVFDGFNVTVPHKRRILDYVDAIDASASVGSAANTLVSDAAGKITAHNTDAPALAKELARLAPELAGRWSTVSALVLGTGGAARSAVVALAVELGVARVVVRGRAHGEDERRESVIEQLAPIAAASRSKTEIVVEPWLARAATERETLVVVQATSAGMHGASDGSVAADAVDWAELPARAVALDVVYAPLETAFLRGAATHGIRATNGIGMLVGQGALAFELWLKMPAPINAMLTALV